MLEIAFAKPALPRSGAALVLPVAESESGGAVAPRTGFGGIERFSRDRAAEIPIEGRLHLATVIGAIDEFVAIPGEGMNRAGESLGGGDDDLGMPGLGPNHRRAGRFSRGLCGDGE